MNRIILISIVALLIAGCVMPGTLGTTEMEKRISKGAFAGMEKLAGTEMGDAESSETLIEPEIASFDSEIGSQTSGESLLQLATQPRKVIYNAALSLGCYDCEKGMKKIKTAAEELGGYLQQETTYSITIRVPAENFYQAIEKLKTFGKIIEKEIVATDVTEEFTDLSLRLEAKQKYLVQLEALLAKGEKVADLLEVQKEIGRLVEEIESLKGKLRYLADRIAFSTIEVEVQQLGRQTGEPGFILPFSWLDYLGIENLFE